MSDRPDLSERQQDLVDQLPARTPAIAEALGISESTVESYRNAIKDKGYPLEYHRETRQWYLDGEHDPTAAAEEESDATDDDRSDGDGSGEDDWADEPVSDTEPSPTDLSDRERYLIHELQTGAYIDDLAADLNTRPSIITRHLRELRSEGWAIYRDETSSTVTIEGDHVLRSSEHKGTRTRKANRWWERRHNQLVREYKALEPPTAEFPHDAGNEDWVTALGDLHAGDEIRREDGTVVYQTSELPSLIDYITQQSIALADRYDATYDVGHLVWGGDFVTSEGVYRGQFEDLDAWLDEQHEILHNPLIRQLKAFSDRFPAVNVVCMVGNHGQQRASGTSRQANSDLILYKSIRNVVANLQEHSNELENVNIQIGGARPYRNFDLRGGEISGHLRHGQNRKPQAETSARQNEWRATLMNHDFDVAYLFHHHISGKIPWEGPPIYQVGSPKPADDFVEEIGGLFDNNSDYTTDIAQAHSVSDDGVTGEWTIDTRYYG